MQSGPFFQNQDTFFDFQERVGEASPPALSSCATVLIVSNIDLRKNILEFT